MTKFFLFLCTLFCYQQNAYSVHSSHVVMPGIRHFSTHPVQKVYSSVLEDPKCFHRLMSDGIVRESFVRTFFTDFDITPTRKIKTSEAVFPVYIEMSSTLLDISINRFQEQQPYDVPSDEYIKFVKKYLKGLSHVEELAELGLDNKGIAGLTLTKCAVKELSAEYFSLNMNKYPKGFDFSYVHFTGFESDATLHDPSNKKKNEKNEWFKLLGRSAYLTKSAVNTTIKEHAIKRAFDLIENTN